MNIFNDDFLEFINALNLNGVRYILVGGYSVILHGYPRTTGDLDIWVENNEDNYRKLEKAFKAFRLPTFDMTLENFMNTDKFDVFRFGRQPIAIDIITQLKGIRFDNAWENVETQKFEGISVNYISYSDLLTAKKASGRARDINDIDNLRTKREE
ncbi:MAG: nucleotidyl transferase AbiEii/AbiGii toxin family protein [Roseivirga sp.]